MDADKTVSIDAELFARVGELARAEGKTVEEVTAEALNRLLKLKGLRHFVHENREAAFGAGLTTRDIPRLVTEYRKDRKPGRRSSADNSSLRRTVR